MKPIALFVLCFLAIATQAQQARLGNPRLTRLSVIQDSTVLRDSLQTLEKSKNEDDLLLLTNYYRAKQNSEKLRAVTELMKLRFPNGRVAYDELYEKLYAAQYPAERERIYKEMEKGFGSNPKYSLDGAKYYVAVSFLGKQNPEKVKEYLNRIKNEAYKTNAFSYAARESIINKDYQLGEELIRKTFADLKGDTTHRGMDEFRRIFSELLYANGKYEEGFPQAKLLYGKKSAQTSVGVKDLSATYLNYLIRLKRYQEAYPEMLAQLRSGLASQLIKNSFKDAYTIVNNSAVGFESFAASISDEFKSKVLIEVRNKMINTKAFNFDVKDVNGKTVRLSDYKGKVVILDFWATWCGPCKALFPKMQLAVNKYKNDKDVVFLFIHTLETSPNPTKAAADYLKNMKYDFNLLMDIKDPVTKSNLAAAGYNIKGIPHKVIIDGSGNVRFASTGNNVAGDDAFLEEMSAMIDLAKGKFTQENKLSAIAQPMLNIGDPAPQMTIDKWLKGTPQTNLRDGKVRVIEFWATWCGPCILGMPHMSDMAARFTQVGFVGVTASEHTDDAGAKAQKFVEVSRKMMDYNVAYANPKGTMGRDWLQASGRAGIPVAFVVNKDGRLGWIGHPMMGLEEAVELALADKLTKDAAADIDQIWKRMQEEGRESDKALKLALKEGRIDDALRLNDEVIRKQPFMIAIASGKKYALLTAKDPKAARAYAEMLIKDHGNAPLVLKSVATTIFEGSDARVLNEVKVNVTGAPDVDLAEKLLRKALECSAPDRDTIWLQEKITLLKSRKI